MHPIEATLIQQVLDHLSALRDVLAVPLDVRGVVQEFTDACAALWALLKLGHLTHSGMSEETRRALLELESEAAALLRSQPVDVFDVLTEVQRALLGPSCCACRMSRAITWAIRLTTPMTERNARIRVDNPRQKQRRQQPYAPVDISVKRMQLT